jgi:DNA-binding CsgD family transcriptional regulator
MRALARADETGSLIAAGTASHWHAELRYHQGALADAIAAAQHTLEICRAGWDMCQAWVAPVLAHAHMDRGELDAAGHAVTLAESSACGSRQHALALASRGRLALLRGDATRALEDLLAAGEHADREAVPPTTLPWRSWASLTANHLALHDLADDLAQTELAWARTIGAPRTLGIVLRAAGTARGGQQGLALLAESAGVLERSQSVLERARILVALGAALRRDGQPAASRDPLRRGLELAQQLGADPLADRARAELSAAGGRRRRRGHETGLDALTPTERRIATLAASGQSTPRIAQALHVTAKTVDWHLGHAYQKLGINSRRQLPTVLDGQPAPAPHLDVANQALSSHI